MKPTNGLVKYIEVVDTKNGSSKIKIRLQPFETYTTMELSNPERVVVDINREDPARKSKLLAKNKSTGPGPMKGKRKGKIKLMDPPTGVPDPALVEAGLLPGPNPKVRSRPVKRASFAPVLSPAIKVIVIDPGHGGKDPGAVGLKGLKEKDVVLDIAKRLRKELLRKCRCKVVLTRNRDVFIPLEERTAFANTQGADLFISVHVNANNSRRVRGVETYFLSPARSKAERYTAARENMVSNGTESKNINDLAFILSDMKNTSKINESSFMAASVQNSLVSTVGRKYRVKDNGVKQAMFYVLHGARMPAVLVETSFISNPREEKRLKSASYRHQIAKGIALGVRNYANESRVASLVN
ncbi:MAG: N-acetylmuramoyl-L-alanine amidase, partial [Nitrospinota bacterium]